jgi:hypothetical protein
MPELTPLWIKKTKIALAAAPPNLPKEDRDRLEKFFSDGSGSTLRGYRRRKTGLERQHAGSALRAVSAYRYSTD